MNHPVQLGQISLRTGLLRFFLFSLLWYWLTDGDLNSWPIGLPVVMLAALVSVLMLPASSWSLPGFVSFILFFLWHSLRGGTDVAWRALHPKMPISPALHNFRFRLPPGFPRVFMANTVNLLPGTLSAEVDDECLTVHVLDASGTFITELHMLEKRLARMLNIELIAKAGEC